MSIKVAVAGITDGALDSLRQVIDSTPSLALVGDLDGGGIAKQAKRQAPDVIVLPLEDISLDDDFVSDALAAAPRALGLVADGSVSGLRELFGMGVNGCILHSAAQEELVSAIHELHEGRRYVGPSLASAVVTDFVVSIARAAKQTTPDVDMSIVQASEQAATTAHA
jgi:DNA-binding NarL/FixJ family response regulator